RDHAAHPNSAVRGKAQPEDRDVGPRLFGSSDRSLPVRHVGDDLQVRLALERSLQGIAAEATFIRNQNPDCLDGTDQRLPPCGAASVTTLNALPAFGKARRRGPSMQPAASRSRTPQSRLLQGAPCAVAIRRI